MFEVKSVKFDDVGKNSLVCIFFLMVVVGGKIFVMKKFISKGVNVNLVDVDIGLVINVVILFGNSDVVKLLIEYDVKLNYLEYEYEVLDWLLFFVFLVLVLDLFMF